MSQRHVLLVDNDKRVLALLSGILEEGGFLVSNANDGRRALDIVSEVNVDAVVLDLVMPEMDGLAVLERLKQIEPALPVIMLSGHGTIERAVRAVKMGAFDFLEKPVSSQKIIVALENCMTMSQLKRDQGFLLNEVAGHYRMIGQSEAMRELLRLIEKVAVDDSPVLVSGESGTGKELVARAIHFQSRRAARPFNAVNCAAIPGDLFEAELFGYEKGAFTGAIRSKPGSFELANQGTLFLDEITEMPIQLQPKLLRAIDTQEIQRLGGISPQSLDIRFIAACNCDLSTALQQGILREDLYYRLSVVNLHVPPLRERREDIPLLVDYYVDQFSQKRKMNPIRFQAGALEILMAHDWPGNIRQLKNFLEKVVILSDDAEITPEFVLRNLDRGNGIASGESLEETRQKAEKERIELKLQALDWNYEEAALQLGISRATLFNKMKTLHITGKRHRKV